MLDSGDQQGGVVVVEAGDGVTEADGGPAARLADSWRMRRSPPEQGSPPLSRAVMAASQSMAAIEVPSLVPQVMNLLVKSSRRRNVPLLMSSAVPASSG
jgi:hypothetical protein